MCSCRTETCPSPNPPGPLTRTPGPSQSSVPSSFTSLLLSTSLAWAGTLPLIKITRFSNCCSPHSRRSHLHLTWRASTAACRGGALVTEWFCLTYPTRWLIEDTDILQMLPNLQVYFPRVGWISFNWRIYSLMSHSSVSAAYRQWTKLSSWSGHSSGYGVSSNSDSHIQD